MCPQNGMAHRNILSVIQSAGNIKWEHICPKVKSSNDRILCEYGTCSVSRTICEINPEWNNLESRIPRICTCVRNTGSKVPD
jgi:hypothetical protein